MTRSAHLVLLLITAIVPGAELVFTDPPAGIASPPGPAPPKLELKDGDRILLVGNTFLERDRHYGSLETLVRSRHPGWKLSLRNIAWPGDTTTVQLRPLNFESFDDTLKRQQPNVVIVSYGSNEAFDGPDGLDRFLEGYRKILDKLAATKPRAIVLLSPIRHEKCDAPRPDPARHNQNLKHYADAIRKLALARGHGFVDLFDTVIQESDKPPADPLTENGIHLTRRGYQSAMEEVARQLGWAGAEWRIEHAAGNKDVDARGVRVEDLQSNKQAVSFQAADLVLPIPAADGETAPHADRTLKVRGLGPGNYQLTVDGEKVLSASAEEWAKGVVLTNDPAAKQVRAMREAIVAKDEFFFHRWRAHNGEYIYGRRAHPGGGNSGNPTFPKEFAAWDKLLEEADARITEMSTPKTRRYELTPVRK